MEKEEEERRREAAIASTPCLQPNFNPKGGVTKHQLSKFRELHKRRLQLKSKSKNKTKSKGDANKSQGTNLSNQKNGAVGLKVEEKEPSLWNSEVFDDGRNEGFKDNDDVSVLSAPKKQKLHWGLDTKERWERKSNM